MIKGIRNMKMERAFRLGAILVGVLSLSLILNLGLTRGDSRVIRTIAGSGEAGFAGNSGLAVEAKLGTTQGLAIDATGNIFVADISNHVVRRIDPSGNITVVAGEGPEGAGYNGDNKPALQARLAAPTGVALDEAGNLYIADDGNHRIRRVDNKGVIKTVAGTGEPGFSGDGGPAVAARLRYPCAIVLDGSGNLYIGDVGNYRIRRVDRASGTISTIAGDGHFGFAGDGGPALNAAFRSISSLAFGPSGDLFLADSYNNRVRRIAPDGTITSVAGNGTFNLASAEELGDGGPAASAVLRWPFGLAFDRAGNLYVAEFASNRIRRVDTNGVISTVAGSGHPLESGATGDGGPADKAKLNRPSGVLVDTSGNIYVSDSGNYRVRKVNAQ